MQPNNYFQSRRQQLDFTQRHISLELGITDSLVGAWETEVRCPPISRAAELAVVYKAPRRVIESEISKQAERMRKERRQAAGK